MGPCNRSVALLALVLLWATSVAEAAPLTWNLTGVVFDDGAPASGSLTYDADTNTLLQWNIDVVGAPTFEDCTYSDTTGLPADPPSATQLTFVSPCFDDNRRLVLDFAQPLTNAGGTSFIQGTSVESFQGGGNPRNVSEGSVTASAPAPRTDEFDTGLRLPAVNVYSDPIILPTGANRLAAKILSGPGHLMAFEFIVSYTSTESSDLPLGRKWTHNYNWRAEDLGNGAVRVKQGDGAADYYDAAGGGAFTPQQPGVPEPLVQNPDNTYTWISTEDDTYSFSPDGKLTSIVDSNGNAFAFAYDVNDRLATVTDATGAVATFSYDGNDRITTVDYAGIESATFSYTGADLTSFIEPGPITSAFTYDVDGNMLTATLAGTQMASNTYSVDGRVISQTNANGTVKTIAYSTGGGGESVATITDGVSNTQTRAYGEGSAMTSWLDVLGGTWTATHDANGDELTITDPLGQTSTKTYDANGNLLTDTDALGNTQSFTYDVDGNIATSTDPLGQVMSFTYDAAGNLASVTDQNGDTTAFDYTTTGIRGMVAASHDRHGHTTSQTWTPSGELESLTDPLGDTVNFAYDSLGRMTALTDPIGNTYQFDYDAAGNPVTSTDPLGNVTTKTFDGRGLLTGETEANGATSTAAYTPSGDLQSITDPLGNVYIYEYDGERRPTKRINPLGNETQYAWNPAGHISSTTDALGNTVSASYNVGGNLTSFTDPRGGVKTFAYDAVNQLVTDTNALGQTISNSYDARGQLSSTTNRRGQTISYDYDPAGRRTTTTLSDNNTITHTWAAGSNLLSLLGPGGLTSHTYDDGERLTSRTDEFGNTIQYNYDSRGNVTQIIYSDGKSVQYAYDALSRLTQVVDWAGRTTTYTYNNVGVLVATQLPDGSSVQHSADLAHRTSSLTDIGRNGKTIFRSVHTRDGLGNTVSETVQSPVWPTAGMTATNRTFTHNAANQLTAEGATPFSNDADGNLIAGPVAGVPIGMTYNDRSQLTMAGPDSYQYDATGLRKASVVNGVARRYIWDTNRNDFARMLEEHDGNGNIVARYVHGNGLISREDTSGNLRVYHYDTRGSTIALTNSAGVITDMYAYDPYGRVVQRLGVTPNPFTYNGRDGVIDDGNGLYFSRIRVYAPELMRFVQADMIALGHLMSTQTLNRYCFARGNPIELHDPRGDVPAAVGAFAIGAGVGFGGQVAANVASGNRDISFGENGIFYNTPGAALGGGITGALDVYAITVGPLGLAGSSALGAAVGNTTNQLLNVYVFGSQNKFDPIDLGVETGTAFVLGGVTGVIGKYADEADPSGKVYQIFANSAQEAIEINGHGVATVIRTVTQSAKANKFVSNVLVRGSRAGIEHHRMISRTVSPPASSAYNWSKRTGRKVGGFFSSNKAGKAKRNKAGRSITRKARKIGKKIKGWF